MNPIQTQLVQENIAISYKLDYLQLHPDIFVYEINIDYPSNAHIIAPRLKLEEFHSGIAHWGQIEEYIKSKNIEALPKNIYTFLKGDSETELEKAEHELISTSFDKSFPTQKVWVSDEMEEMHCIDEPVKIKITDFLNESGELCHTKLGKLRIANPRQKPFIYNSQLQLIKAAVRFNGDNSYSLNSHHYNLDALLKHLSSMSQVKINKGVHQSNSSRMYNQEDRPDIIDITYFMSLKETQMFNQIYNHLISLPLKGRQNYNPYEDSINVFLYLDFLQIMEREELRFPEKLESDDWKYNYDLNHYRELLPLKERVSLGLEIVAGTREANKIKL